MWNGRDIFVKSRKYTFSVEKIDRLYFVNLRKYVLHASRLHMQTFSPNIFSQYKKAMKVNYVNKAYLVHSLFLLYFFLVYLSISTLFGRLCDHHQEKQLCLCDTWYSLFCVDDCTVCSHPRRITSTKCCINTVVSPDDGHIVGRNIRSLTNTLRINILRINYAPSWLYLQDYTGMQVNKP